MRNPIAIPAALLLLAALSACAEPARIAGTPSGYTDLECASYARQVSGVRIHGDAGTWWHSAAGRYGRSNKPSPMSVLVLRRTRQLPGGHVAVVRSVVGAREIRVDHANWDDGRTRGRIYENMSVIDVSPRNDWTSLRFWNGAGYGKVYAAHGFIHNRSMAVDMPLQASR
jgi:surface antigen